MFSRRIHGMCRAIACKSTDVGSYNSFQQHFEEISYLVESSCETLSTKSLYVSLPSTPQLLQTYSCSTFVKQLLGDVVVASIVSFGIAPFVAIVDKSVIQVAAGSHTVKKSCTQSVRSILNSPSTFIRSPAFMMMWGVYAVTYSTGEIVDAYSRYNIGSIESLFLFIYIVANCVNTISNHNPLEYQKEDILTSSMNSNSFSMGVLCLTTVVNSSSSIVKDRFYVKLFGITSSSTAMRVPFITYGLWGLRDCVNISSSFILPKHVSKALQNHTTLDNTLSLQLAQLACPILAQFIATPLQLLGLDFCNRPLPNHSLMGRIRFQQQNLTAAFVIRLGKIAPAFCIGGIGNTYLRDWWRNSFLSHA